MGLSKASQRWGMGGPAVADYQARESAPHSWHREFEGDAVSPFGQSPHVEIRTRLRQNCACTRGSPAVVDAELLEVRTQPPRQRVC